jgi:hypothetical protein
MDGFDHSGKAVCKRLESRMPYGGSGCGENRWRRLAHKATSQDDGAVGRSGV